MRVQDPIERGEARAEAWLEDSQVDRDHFKCGCGRVVAFTDAHPSGPDPYAAPVCGDCLEQCLHNTNGGDDA